MATERFRCPFCSAIVRQAELTYVLAEEGEPIPVDVSDIDPRLGPMYVRMDRTDYVGCSRCYQPDRNRSL